MAAKGEQAPVQRSRRDALIILGKALGVTVAGGGNMLLSACSGREAAPTPPLTPIPPTPFPAELPGTFSQKNDGANPSSTPVPNGFATVLANETKTAQATATAKAREIAPAKPETTVFASRTPTSVPRPSETPSPAATYEPGYSAPEVIKEAGWRHYTSKQLGYEADVPYGLPNGWFLFGSSANVDGWMDYGTAALSVNVIVPTPQYPVSLPKMLEDRKAIIVRDGGVKSEEIQVTPVKISGADGYRLQIIRPVVPRQSNTGFQCLEFVTVIKGNGWEMGTYQGLFNPDRVKNVEKFVSSFKVDF